MPVPQTTFKIFAPLLKTSLGPDGKKRLHGVASSTITDRHGDEMTVSALADMERSAAQNMTIFLNHSYDVPEDVAGSVERAAISRSEQDPDIHDLALDVVVNEANERAVKAWEAIDGGTKLGLSIGAMIPDGGATRKDSGAYTIDHVELLETSLVGVPANPRSWVEYAVKALTTGEENGTMTHVNGVVTDLEPKAGIIASDEPIADEEVCPKCNDRRRRRKENDCTDEFHDEEKSVTPEDDAADTPTFSAEEEEPEVEIASTAASAAPTEEPPDPDKTDATVTVETEHAKISVDTGNRGKAPSDGASQEAQESVPENEDQDEDSAHWADGLDLTGEPEEDDIRAALQVLEPTVTASLKTSTQLVAVLTRELGEAREERDEAVKEAAGALALAKEVLDMVAATPAGRRAVIPEAQKKVVTKANSLEAVYGKAFVEALRKDD